MTMPAMEAGRLARPGTTAPSGVCLSRYPHISQSAVFSRQPKAQTGSSEVTSRQTAQVTDPAGRVPAVAT